MDDAALLAVLKGLERQPHPAVVHFTDGEIYDLRIISTTHAEDGGDVVAEVVRAFSPRSSKAIRDGDFINFYLADVARITIDGNCIFERVDGA